MKNALALLAAAGALLGATPAEPGPEPRKPRTELPTPAHLPAGARMLLLERMGNHRVDMSRLSQAVLFLDHEEAGALARRIAEEPRLAEPGDADELNSLIPPRFFELQDELRERAEALAAAARKGDDAAIAKAYGRLNETCVRCHAVWMQEP